MLLLPEPTTIFWEGISGLEPASDWLICKVLLECGNCLILPE